VARLQAIKAAVDPTNVMGLAGGFKFWTFAERSMYFLILFVFSPVFLYVIVSMSFPATDPNWHCVRPLAVFVAADQAARIKVQPRIREVYTS
jgi:hypothetical protein